MSHNVTMFPCRRRTLGRPIACGLCSCSLAIRRLSACIALFLAGTAAGNPHADQPRADEAGGAVVDDRAGGDVDKASIYLNDSFEAMDAFVSASALARQRNWFDSSEVIRRVLRQHKSKLIEIEPTFYTSVPQRFRALMSDWPAEGIAAYQSLVGAEFDEQLERLGESASLDELLSVLDGYYNARGSEDLIDRAGELALEAGAFALAARCYQDASRHHFARDRHGARWQAMATIARQFRSPSTALPDGVAADFTLPWKGRDTSLESILADIRVNFAAASELGSLHWPVFGGRPSRFQQTHTRVTELGLLWRVDLTSRPQLQPSPTRFEEDVAPDHLGRMGIEPVVASGLVLVQLLRDVVAFNLNTGAEVWRFKADLASGQESDDLDDFPTGWYSVTVASGRVFAAIPGDTAPYYGYESARSIAELVCLDLETGQLVWRSSRLNLGDEYSELSFDSSPLVVSNRVYVVGRRRRSFGFEDCYLHAFDATNGVPLFRSHIGSASTGSFGSQRATVSVPGMRGDSVFVSTNLGTIAAVSAHTGAVRWLRLYDRLEDGRTKGGGWSSGRVRPWEFNPAMITQGRIFCLPIDSEDLLILDEETGSIVRRVSLESLSNMRTIIGVKGDVLCGTGDEVVCYDHVDDAMLWSSPIPRSDPVAGRGCWNNDVLMVPTGSGVHRIKVSDGSMQSLAWPPEGTGGNILALPDRFMVAGGQQISQYVQKDEIWSSVRSRMFASPNDPAPALDLAEVAFGSGEFKQAIEALSEAVDRLDRDNEIATDEHRARVFTDALVFAEKLAARNALTVETADELLQYAAMFAISEHDHVRYRVKFASVFADLAVPIRSVDLWQQVLLDATLRASRFADLGLGQRTAGAAAEEAIDRFIQAHGDEVYGPHERTAARQFAAARDVGDISTLTRLANAYPNSSSASRAILLTAQLNSQSGDNASAMSAYRLAYHRYGNQIDRAEVMLQLADGCRALGRMEEGYHWLTRAGREFPTRLVEYRGQRLTLTDYRNRLHDTTYAPSRPTLVLPFHHGFVRDIREGDQLLEPEFRSNPRCDWSRYFVRTADGVKAYHGSANREAWKAVVPFADPPGLLIDTRDVSVFATRTQLTGISPRGERLWTIGDVPSANPLEDWESVDLMRVYDIRRDRILASQGDRVFLLDLDDGRVLWDSRALPRPGRRGVISRRWVAFDTTRGGDSALYILDVESGEMAGVINTSEAWAVEDLIMTYDDRLVLCTSRSLTAYDVEQTEPVWQVSLDGQLELDTVLRDVDGIYLSDDGRRMKKFSVYDGTLQWTSPRILPRIQQAVRADFLDGNIVMSSTKGIGALDPITKLPLWSSTNPADPRFRFRGVSDRFIVALHLPNEMESADSSVYFFDYHNGSGQIPTIGGEINLGSLEDVRVVTLANNALIIQSESTIFGWTHQEDTVPLP